MSAWTQNCVLADASVLPQVTSKSRTPPRPSSDRPSVRPSVRPFEIVCVTTLVVASARTQLFARTRFCVHEDARMCSRGCIFASPRTLGCIHADTFLRPHGRNCPRGRQCFFYSSNFKMDATVRPSHGHPCSHRPTVCPSVCYRSCDNPG
jgi:hypothetical protein